MKEHERERKRQKGPIKMPLQSTEVQSCTHIHVRIFLFHIVHGYGLKTRHSVTIRFLALSTCNKNLRISVPFIPSLDQMSLLPHPHNESIKSTSLKTSWAGKNRTTAVELGIGRRRCMFLVTSLVCGARTKRSIRG